MKLTISNKIGGAFLGLSLMLLICGGAGYYVASVLSDGLDFVTNQAWDAADGAMEGTIGLQGQIIQISRLIDERDQPKRKELLTGLQENVALEEEALSRMITSGLFDQATVSELNNMRSSFDQSRQQVLSALDGVYEAKTVVERNNAGNLLNRATIEFETTVDSLLAYLEKMEEAGDSKVESYAADLDFIKAESYAVLFATTIIGVLLAIGAYVMILISAIKPIKAMAAKFLDIAEGDGDLTVRLPEKGQDEITDVSRGFNLFVGKTRDTICTLKEAAIQVSDSIGKLTTVSHETTTIISSEQQQTEQVASAMTEMVSTVQEVSRNVGDAAKSANDARQEAVKGQTVVGQTITQINTLAGEVKAGVEVLQRVEQDSQKVGTILDVIKGIAEQTNLLALKRIIRSFYQYNQLTRMRQIALL